MHAHAADRLPAKGLVNGLVFAVLEILPSSIHTSEKPMWIIGFLFLNWKVVILYLAVGRNRILGQNSIAGG
jgi:hypothetical protein